MSRLLTVFPILYAMRQGIRASLAPAVNLSQLSEFSLVLLQIGVAAGQVDPNLKAATSFAFVLLAALSTLAMTRSNRTLKAAVPLFKRLGIRDLDQGAVAEDGAETHAGGRIMLLGFFRTASSLIADLEARDSPLLADLAVVDFNPVVHQTLTDRGLRVIYGDISQSDTLMHAGVGAAEVLICTVPDFLLKGITNERLVKQLRSLNPKARIVAPADLVSDVAALYAAGADYVFVPRLVEARELCEVLEAADCGLLPGKRQEVDARLQARHEVLA